MAREQQEETGVLPCCTDAHGVLAWISALFRAYLVQSGWFCTRRMLVMRLLGKPPCFSHHPITISVSASSSLHTTQAFQSSPDMLSYLHPYTDCPSLTHSLTYSLTPQQPLPREHQILAHHLTCTFTQTVTHSLTPQKALPRVHLILE